MKDITYEVSRNYIGLSTEEKPTENVDDGSTFLCADTADTFIFYDGAWYKQ